MEWIVVVGIGCLIGLVVSFVVAGTLKMPRSLTIIVGIVGAVVGGIIARVSGFFAFGDFTFYISATALSVALLSGGVLGFSLTNEEKRI